MGQDVSDELPNKTDVLALATNALTQQVAILTGVVTRNNQKIDGLQKEMMLKPDDTEVKFIACDSKRQRTHNFRVGIATAVGSALVASGISYAFAQQQINERVKANFVACERNNARSDELTRVFEETAALTNNIPVKEGLLRHAEKLKSLNADCARLHPIG